jgi:hypothetical protein
MSRSSILSVQTVLNEGHLPQASLDEQSFAGQGFSSSARLDQAAQRV